MLKVTGEAMSVWNLISADRNSLLKLKRISLRNGSWFRMLSWEKRRLFDAVIVVVRRIRSSLLLKILAPSIMKLLGALGGSVRRNPVKEEVLKGALTLMDKAAYVMMKTVAERISLIAQSWGNKQASTWPKDRDFIKYLITMYLPKNGNVPISSLNIYLKHNI